MKYRYWVALAALFLFLTGAASGAYPVNDPINVIVVKEGIPQQGVLVQFALNDGTPVLTTTDSLGKVKFVPLTAGNLTIHASTMNGVKLADPISVSVAAGGDQSADVIITLSGSQVPDATPGVTPTTTAAPGVTPTTTTTPGTPPGSGGSTGGGAGGGVATSEPFSNIERSEQHDKDLLANKPVTYDFTSPELGIYQVVVTGKVNEYDIGLKVEALKGPSKLAAGPAPGIVYKHANIWAGTKQIKDVLIRFKVKSDWMSGSGIAGSEIRLVKWDGTRWITLETSETKKDGTHTYFEAKTDGLSPFALTGIKTVPSAAPPSGIATPVKQEETATRSTATQRSVPGFEAIIAMAAFPILYMLRLKRR